MAKSNTTRDLAVGVTAVAGLIALALLMLVFGYAPGFAQKTYPVTIQMPDSGGLKAESRIKLAGIEIGKVTSVEFAQGGPGEGVVVLAQINEEFEIPVGTTVAASAPLLGGSAIAMLSPPKDSDTFYPKDGSAILKGRPASLFGDLEGPLSEFASIASKVETLADEWTEVGENVNQLLELRGVASVDAGDAMSNISTLIERLDGGVAEAREVMERIDTLLNDPEFEESIRTTLANAADVSEAAGDVVRTTKKAIEDAQENIGAIRRRVALVADDMSKALTSAQDLLDKANDGDGTVGKLLNDPELANNLNDASVRMQKLLDEARLLIQKWKAEGLPVQF